MSRVLVDNDVSQLPDGATRVGAGTVRLRSSSRSARATPPRSRPLKYGKWRALALGSVYLLFGLHIAHWKLNGSTLAPLELNELMYTLEAGVVTAGFLLMATLFVATAFVGRFFCSWACHIMALEDLCSWLLGKLRIRPRPVRSRLLLAVPPIALLYMFVWPQILRIYEGRPAPRLRFLTDEDGWASFVTKDFWRNLPDPGIAALTFLVCGFAVVYFLGSRSFCMHACPYGAVFGLVDRIAPGRIKLTGHCEQCGICTSVCSSHVRVHEEIAQHGKVVDANCMKDLDCVSACPEEAIKFGFTSPPGFTSFAKTGRRKLRFDFSPAEDLLMVTTFIAVVVVFRGLYLAVPFLMTLGLAGIVAYLAVLCLRMARRTDVRLVPFRLKNAGRLTRSGRVFAAAMIAFGLFFVHSAFIRYHEVRGQRAFDNVRLAEALGHLTAARRWGLFHPLARDEQLASLHLKSDDPALAEPYLHRITREDPGDTDSQLALSQLLAESGRLVEAQAEAEAALAILDSAPNGTTTDPSSQRAGGYALLGSILLRRGEGDEAIGAYGMAAAGNADDVQSRMRLGELLAEREQYVEAVALFRDVISLQPELTVARYNLAVALAGSGDARGAIESYREVLARVPDDVQTRLNLGFLFVERGELHSAAEQFGRAVELEPGLGRAHFNLAAVHQRQGDLALADVHYRRAAELDPAYAAKIPSLSPRVN